MQCCISVYMDVTEVDDCDLRGHDRAMSGRAPLMLAAFLFGIGASGLLLLATAEQRSWGPFQPPSQPSGPSKVVVYDVSPPFAPPPLHELFTSYPPQTLVAATEAQVVETEPVAEAEEPEPTPTPSPIRIFGVSSDDPGVSAAASTPTPVTLRIGGISADSAVEATETPTAEEAPAATPEP